MRTALIFPPQWDPRQPPLGPALLAQILRQDGAETKVYDLNLALYWKLLKPGIRGGIEEFLIKRMLDPNSLKDAQAYLQSSGQVQKIFDERFDPGGKGRLFWDTVGGISSSSSSQEWQAAVNDPKRIPFIAHLKNEIDEILGWAPATICISAISDTQIIAAIALAAIFRRSLPDVQIFLGGAAITYRRSLLGDHQWLNSTFTAISPGEGESFFANLVLKTSPEDRPESTFVQQSGNFQIDFQKSEPASILHSPDFSCLPLDKYLTPHLVIPVETARGCPWGRCSFCIHPVRAAIGRPTYRVKPDELIKKELKQLFDAGHRHFLIVDEALPPFRMKQLAEIFLSFNEPVAWICYIRLDEGHNRDIFNLARASGCRKLFIGVESGSDRILRRFNKGVNPARARRVLLEAAAAGLAVHSFLMTGFPGEEESDRQATLDLLADVWPAFDPFGVSYDLFMLTAELETELTADPQKFGWQGPARNGHNDLAWQFPIFKDSSGLQRMAEFKTRIDELADQLLGRDFGLRHAALAQDSLHLLLLEAREKAVQR